MIILKLDHVQCLFLYSNWWYYRLLEKPKLIEEMTWDYRGKKPEETARTQEPARTWRNELAAIPIMDNFQIKWN